MHDVDGIIICCLFCFGDDKLLFEANEKLETYLRGNIVIPDGWDIEHFKTIPTKLIILKLRNDIVEFCNFFLY